MTDRHANPVPARYHRRDGVVAVGGTATATLDSLRLMDGIIDIYLPDLKVWTPAG